MVLALASHIPISNSTFHIIGKKTNSTVSEYFQISLLSDNPSLVLYFERLEACLCYLRASGICTPLLSISI
jgi:hypothetical protein